MGRQLAPGPVDDGRRNGRRGDRRRAEERDPDPPRSRPPARPGTDARPGRQSAPAFEPGNVRRADHRRDAGDHRPDDGEFENLDEIRNVAVARGDGGKIVYVRDVAVVDDSHEEARVITRFNGDPCVKLAVLKQAEANTVDVSRAVNRRLEELRAVIPPDIRFGVVENQADYIMAAIKSVRDSALIAAILVILVVYAFLGRFRQVAVMLVALPLTVLANFFLMKIAGFSLNIFSLGGLVVAMGVVIDNSIVVIENITRRAEEGRSGRSPLKGTDQVAGAVLAATLTFLSLFLPFLLVPGLTALLFRELVFVVAGILISLSRRP
ncbi:MAG: efflux RND transporter permease subunit [Marinilabiliales bacterium]|nr:efflux RND transporter permease subunit [Marinilabiliales bacterium]